MLAKKNARKKNAKKKGAKKKGSIVFKARHFFLSPFYAIWWMTKRMPAWLKWPSRLGLSAGVVAGSLAVFVSIVYYIVASTYDLDEVVTMPARTEILDRDGNILKNSKGQEVGYLHGKNRRIVSYDEVSPYFVDALIAREDARFREHGAVDLRAFGRVAFRFITRGKLEGGGTISMQLARNSYRLK
ncbi:transglycosylase domain-containing protein, partial [bacterium]|nr:transglycosylase domain-containing protein [bacterium]